MQRYCSRSIWTRPAQLTTSRPGNPSAAPVTSTPGRPHVAQHGTGDVPAAAGGGGEDDDAPCCCCSEGRAEGSAAMCSSTSQWANSSPRSTARLSRCVNVISSGCSASANIRSNACAARCIHSPRSRSRRAGPTVCNCVTILGSFSPPTGRTDYYIVFTPYMNGRAPVATPSLLTNRIII